MAATGAALLAPRVSFASSTVLSAGPVVAQILPEGDGTTATWGLNGSTPGPALRLAQGERAEITFENGLMQPSALHWHGIRLENAMDGVPGLTQDAVPPGGRFDYSFVPPDAGTYWYHSHNRSWEQVARGIYGPLIVEETTPPDVDHDVIVMVDDWRLSETGEQLGGYDDLHDRAHAGRMGNYARALVDPAVQLRQGERVRLRLINVATDRVFPVQIDGIKGRIVALDGMPLPAPAPIGDILLAPAQRIDIIADVTGAEQLGFVFPTRDGPYDLGAIPVSGVRSGPARGDIAALPGNPGHSLDLEAASEVPLRMEGGAMGGRHSGSDVWAFNGVSDLLEAPLRRFERGETARFRLVND
ncbi:MAG: multicopper oxidase domain-containing protein, partial [Alphaproteobacteria bacterium]|nr:multicopper oxidase domain-containing protein [Alphaproteobacteria bacterium]